MYGIAMKIRDAVLVDAERLGQVHVETWRSSYAGIMPAEVLANLSQTESAERWTRHLVEMPAGEFAFVAEGEGGQVVGFCAGGRERDGDPDYDGEIYAIYVLPEAQGQGVGRGLMQAGARRLRAQGHKKLLVWMLAENTPARGFYAALGGQPVREREIDIRGVRLPEVGYGWEDLEGLAGETIACD